MDFPKILNEEDMKLCRKEWELSGYKIDVYGSELHWVLGETLVVSGYGGHEVAHYYRWKIESHWELNPFPKLP